MGFGIPRVVTSTSASGAQVIDGSSVFNGDNHYLTKTFSGAGNRRTFTFSFWVKRSEFGVTNMGIFSEYPGSGNGEYIRFSDDDSGDTFRFFSTQLSNQSLVTKRKFRDTGWYHICVAVDTTQGADIERVKIYINSERNVDWASATWPSQDAEYDFMNATAHYIGRCQSGTYLPGYLSQFYVIDGQALGPGYFGYTDPLTNTWRPKAFRAEGTTVNDGTVWSSGATNGSAYSGSYTWTTAFSGNPMNSYGATESGTSTNPYNIALPDIPFSTLTLYTQYGGANGIWVNGIGVDCSGNVSLGSGADSQTVGSSTFTAEQLGFGVLSQIGVNGQNRWFGLAVDGVLMVDSTTQNLDYGTNGFYLPFDGNSLIGKDESGKGNDWTPVNFGGSNVIPKATGALPILNTVNGGKVATAGVRTDASGNSCVLALPLVGSATDVSNQVNSGSTTKVMTAVGNAAASSVSNFYGGSYYFDGTGDGLTCPDNTDFEFGSGDFTVECWVKQGSTSGFDVYVGKYGGSSDGEFIVGKSTNTPCFYWQDSSGNANINATNFTGNTSSWYHMACVRHGDVFTMYINGICENTTTDATTIKTTSNKLTIGIENDESSSAFEGYIQDVRIYKGVAKYTGSTIGRQYFIPASTNPDIRPDTPSGVVYGSELTKVTDGAVKFDGTGDYLSLPDSADWDLGDTFTIEAWVNLEVLNNYNAVIAQGESSSGDWYMSVNSNGSCQFYDFTGGEQIDSSAGVVAVNTWNHIAISVNSGTAQWYVNGTASGSSGALNVQGGSSSGLTIGIQGTLYPFKGYISNLRVVKGTALYTANFTPPTAPLTNVTNTKLLCCQSQTQAGAAVTSPNMGGINDGTVWSDTTDPSLTHAEGVRGIFDGLLTTRGGAPSTDNNYAVLTDGCSISASTGIRIYWNGVGAGQRYIRINGSTELDDGSAQLTPGWSSVSSYSGTINKIEVKTASSGSWSLSAVEVDGTILTDPITANGDAAATYFNPFTDDINTVMGKETGYCTLNPLASYGALSDGNLVQDGGAGSYYATSTMSFSSGKWYAEFALSDHSYPGIGVCSEAKPDAGWMATQAPYYFIYDNGSVLNNYPGGAEHFSPLPTTLFSPGIFKIALDVDNGKAWIGYEGVWYSDQWATTGNPETGANPTFILPSSYVSPMSPPKEWFFFLYSNDATWTSNFGQKPLKYVPPEGFQPPNYANLPSPGVVRPDQYVGVTTYPGTGSSPYTISGYQFSPDLVWVKETNGTRSNILFDTVRGVQEPLYSDTADEQLTAATSLLSFNHDGFTVGTDAHLNQSSSHDYVGWCWKAGGNKNTYNVDDRGYATAAEVNMSVGSLNSGAYNQDEVWSQGTSASAAFDGDFFSTGFNPVNTTFKTLTTKPFTVVSQIGVWLRDFGPAFTIYIEYNGVEYSAPGTISDWTYFDVPASTNTLLRIKCSASSDECRAVSVDGVILVDNGITPPSLPSIAPSAATVGTKQGFSIIKYTGAGSGSSSLPHGLLKSPDFIITKDMDSTTGWWAVYNSGLRADRGGYLNDEQAFGTHAFWAGVEPGSQTTGVYSIGANANTNSGNNFISYIWHNVPGLQKFGSYQGNDVDNGPFIYLGFRPAIVMFKNASTASTEWIIVDSKRDPDNVVNHILNPNNSSADDTSTNLVDFLSNGFKLRSGTSRANEASNKVMIYAAWAHQPMDNLYGAQSNAR